MRTVGPGVRELRYRDQNGAFRIIYVAQFVQAVYVLHCFQKKTEKTTQNDIEIARSRLAQIEENRT
jgi:phage-related protein